MADAATPIMFAVVTTKKDTVWGGMAPIFYAENEQEQVRIALWISRITNADVHDLHNGTMILIVNASGS